MAVDPNQMGAGPMIPPPPTPPTPMAPPAAGGPVPPAVAALPGMAQLAQAQSLQMADHQRQMMAMQEEMNKQIMMLIASLPTPNPAGEAAVSTPTSPMMAGDNTGSAPASQQAPAAPMGGASSAY